MPNTRVMLWAALAAILFLNYEAWVRDYPASAGTSQPALGSTAGSNKLGESLPQADAARTGEASPASTAAPQAATPPAAATSAADDNAAAVAGPPLHVVTDVLDVDINLKGGELDRADLLQYPLHKDMPNVPVRLLNHDSDETLYLLQTGLIAAGSEVAPTHLAT